MKIVVIGAGGVGQHIARKFSTTADVVLVDSDVGTLRYAEDILDVLTVAGCGGHRNVLKRAGVSKADLVVAVTNNDDTNLCTAALAVDLGAQRAIARVNDPAFYCIDQSIERDVLGVDVLCESRLICVDLLRRLVGGDAEVAAAFVGGTIQVAVVEVPPDSPLVGSAAIRFKAEGEKLVSAVQRGSKIRPAVEISHLEVGDRLVLSGKWNLVPHGVRKVCGREPGRVALVGGSEIGVQLAQVIRSLERDLRIIDHDRKRCHELAIRLEGVSIIHGDGTNLSFLRDEQIGTASSVFAVTRSDEVNLMTSLLSRELGTSQIYSLVQRPGYVHIYETMGIDATSAHEVFARSVDWLLPGRICVGRTSIPGTDCEVIECHLPKVLKRSLTTSDIPVPRGTIWLGRCNAKTGAYDRDLSSPLLGNEHLIAIVHGSEVRELEKSIAKLGTKAGK